MGPLRVTSSNPVRDAEQRGHHVGMSRSVRTAKESVLLYRYRKFVADVEQAEDDEERTIRLEGLLLDVAFACESVADDLTTLKNMHDGVEHRDKLAAEVEAEVLALAELTVPDAEPASDWSAALNQLRAHAEALLRSDERTAEHVADLDLVLERIERAEHSAGEALRGYFRYMSA